MARPATSATERPAPSDPVRVTARTRSSSITSATCCDEMSSVWNAPGGYPARRNTSSISSAVWGTFDACFNRPTLPAMRPGAANRITCHIGKVPGHDGQYGSHGLVAHTALGGGGADQLVGEQALGVLGEPAQGGGALGHLALGRREGLAHLGGEDPGDVGKLSLEQLGGRRRQVRPLLERRRAVEGEGALGRGELGLYLRSGVGLEDLLGLARGGIDGRDRHGKIIAHRAGRGTPPRRGTRPHRGTGERRGQSPAPGGDRSRPRAPGRSRRRSLPVGVWGSSPTRKYDLGRL